MYVDSRNRGREKGPRGQGTRQSESSPQYYGSHCWRRRGRCQRNSNLNLLSAKLLLLVSLALLPFVSAQSRSQYCTDEYGHDFDIGSCKTYEHHVEQPQHSSNSYCSSKCGCLAWSWCTWCCGTSYYVCDWVQWQCDACNDGLYIVGSSRNGNSMKGVTSPASGADSPLHVCGHCGLGYSCSGGVSRKACALGKYSDTWSATSCKTCKRGTYAIDGNGGPTSSAAVNCKSCPLGRYGSQSGQDSPNDCPKCAPGKHAGGCPNTALECPKDCELCPGGKYQSSEGQAGDCEGDCQPGYRCPTGAVSATQEPCTEYSQSVETSHMYFCPLGSGSSSSVSSGSYTWTSSQVSVPSGRHEAYHHDSQSACPAGTYCLKGVMRACPLGRYQSYAGQTSCTLTCAPGYHCNNNLAANHLATSSTPAGVVFSCGSVEYYCPNTASTNYQRILVSPNHYTLCGDPGSDLDAINCPEAYRTRQESCSAISSQYYCSGGRRHRWITMNKCSAGEVHLQENNASASVGETVVQFTGDGTDPRWDGQIYYKFGSESVPADPCEEYFWSRMDKAAFRASGTIRLAGVAGASELDYENSVCQRASVALTAVPVDGSAKHSEPCVVTVAISDHNDAPLWQSWSLSVSVDEGAPPKTMLGDPGESFEVRDPDGDQVTFSIKSGYPLCGPSATPCPSKDWFEVGSCDGKVRIRGDADIIYGNNLNPIVYHVEAQDDANALATRTIGNAPQLFGVITINVVNIPSPPSITGPSGGFFIHENTKTCGSFVSSQSQNSGNPDAECRLTAVDPHTVNGSIVVTDEDNHGMAGMVYSTFSPNDDWFYVNPSNGAVYIIRNLDYEAMGTLSLHVRVTDNAFFTDDKVFQVKVLNRNDPPNARAACVQGMHVSEDASVGELVHSSNNVLQNNVIGNVFDEDCFPSGVCDSDFGTTDLTFSIDDAASSPAAPPFNFSGPTSPTLLVTHALDFESENSYSIVVIITDTGLFRNGTFSASDPLLSDTCTLLVTIGDENEPPIIFPGQSWSVSENSNIGTALLPAINVTDEDSSVLGFRVSSEYPPLDNTAFQGTSRFQFGTGTPFDLSQQLHVASELDVDAMGTSLVFVLTVEVTDYVNIVRANISINITGVNEPPSLEIPVSPNVPLVPEDCTSKNCLVHGKLNASDPEGSICSFNITDCLAAQTAGGVCKFKISSSGQLFVNMPALSANMLALDYETKSSYNFEVTVTDDGIGGGSSDTLSSSAFITVQVGNVNDVPIVVMPGDISILSVSKAASPYGSGTIVGSVMVRDDDLALPKSIYNESVSLEIIAGNVDSTWTLSNATRYRTQISWNLLVDTVPPSGGNLRTANYMWNLTLKAQDKAGQFSTHYIQIFVQDGNLAPTLNGLPRFQVNESVEVGTLISQLQPTIAQDADLDPVSLYITNIGYIQNGAETQPGQLARQTVSPLSNFGFISNDTHPLDRFATMGVIDYETIVEFDIFVTIVDDPSARDFNFIPKLVEGQIKVTVNDINEPPILLETGKVFLSIPENSPNGTPCENVIVAKDPDANTVLSFALVEIPGQSVEDRTVFAVLNAGSISAGGTGTFLDEDNNAAQLVVANSSLLDFESAKKSFVFGIKASDGELISETLMVNVSVTDLPEPPKIFDTSVSVYENDAEWQHCVSIFDPDYKSSNRIVFGTDPASIKLSNIILVDPTSGCISLRVDSQGFDFENTSFFKAKLVVFDEENNLFNDTATISIHVLDAMDIEVVEISPMTLPTRGGMLMINGSNFGPTLFKLTNDPEFQGPSGSAAATLAQTVSLTFKNPSSGLMSDYSASMCEILPAINTALKCVISEGVGRDFTWTLKFGNPRDESNATNRTIVFKSSFAFESPILETISIPDNNGLLATYGKTRIVFTGKNFGPRSMPSSAIEIKYARGLSSLAFVPDSAFKDLEEGHYKTTDCNISVSHTEIECLSGPGVGIHLEFYISNLAGAQSNVLGREHNHNRTVPLEEFMARYEAPELTFIKMSNNVKIASYENVTELNTQGGELIDIVGHNFGPAGSRTKFLSESSAITYGPEGFGYTATDCFVSKAQTTITCRTIAGTGSGQTWIVTRGDQRSSFHLSGKFLTRYAKPSVTRVSGLTALTSSDTQGGQVLTIYGQNFGMSTVNSISGQISNIRVLYGNPTLSEQEWFLCTDVNMLTPSIKISCIMTPGTGANLSLVVIVDGQKSPMKNSAVGYGAPIIIDFFGPGANRASTSGEESITIRGRNFGAKQGAANLDRVVYGRASLPHEKWHTAKDCTILSHFLINCKTSPGGGADLVWRVSVSGQNSSAPTTDYAPPFIEMVSSFPSGTLLKNANSDGGDVVELIGGNFGPTNSALDGDGPSLVESVTFGPQGQQYSAVSCNVTTLSTVMRCRMPPGIGSSLRWQVTVAGQKSVVSPPLVSYAKPKLVHSSSYLIRTAGQYLTLSGIYFGLRVPDINIYWMFGSQIHSSVQIDPFVGIEHPRMENFDNIVISVPPLEDFSKNQEMVNVSSLVVLQSGGTTVLSNPILLSYHPPTVMKVFTYEGTTAALRVVIEGDNFCGSLSCGQVEIFNDDGATVSISNYISWTHTRVEIELPIDKGSFVVTVGKAGDGNAAQQRSSLHFFEHMSPIIDGVFIQDSNGAKRAGPFSTRGGDLVTIEGRYFRNNKDKVEIYVANAKSSQILSISQEYTKGPHFYKIVATIPVGQGLAQPLRVVLKSDGTLGPSESEPVMVNYKPPSGIMMNLHHFPTEGSSVTFTGVNMGTCVYLLFDGVLVDSEEKLRPMQVSTQQKLPCSNVTRTDSMLDSVTLLLPEGDGKGHFLSISAGGQVPDPLSGWEPASTQCNQGKSPIASGMDGFGWFEYDSPIVDRVTPSVLPTSANIPIVIRGRNFGVSMPTVTLYSRTETSSCPCSSTVDALCQEGISCSASFCCGTIGYPGCGCYSSSCSCCSEESACLVTSSNHTHIVCNLQEGQGKDLEVSVRVNGQVSSISHSENKFSFLPPSILNVYPLSSPTRGGVTVTIEGNSFGVLGATIHLLGDSLGSGIFAEDIGPISATSQNHTHITFQVPEGHGRNRRVQLTVGSQAVTYTSSQFSYFSPIFTKIEQPNPCSSRIRTINCGSPTIGGFKIMLHGYNFGAQKFSGLMKVRVGGSESDDAEMQRHVCCDSCSDLMSLRSSFSPMGGGDAACACCVESVNHEMITILAPEGIGRNQAIELDYGYSDWLYKSSISYDPPYINFINPQVGNANGDIITFHGINFGMYGAFNVSELSIGNWTCTNKGSQDTGNKVLSLDSDDGLSASELGKLSWAGTGRNNEAVACSIGNGPVGSKDISITVGDQKSSWSKDEWDSPAGHRLFRSECPTNWHGRDGEPCFECPFVTDEKGVTIFDARGDKQYMGTCSGGTSEPIAKSGFYLSRVQRTCGNTGIKCIKNSDCISGLEKKVSEGEECTYKFTKGAEYCNETMKAIRPSCTYILSCEPAEACEAANVCRIVAEGTKDPITNREIEARGYSNTSISTGKFVERCSACAIGYFRVGGLCEQCPKNIGVIAVIFVLGIVLACVGAYILHLYQVNLAMAAIGVDYAQVMSMFLKSDIRWPGEIRVLFRLLSSLNFDLDIASPECLLRDIYRYDLKWYGIMCLPVGCALIFLIIHAILWSRKKFWLRRRRNLNKHTHAMVSMNLVMMYFLYLYLTRSTLDVFNCVPLDPPDKVHPDWTYMTAVGGVRCYEVGSLQMKLLPFAVLGIIFYTLGYPALLALLLWRNKARIQEDQVLRASGKGDRRVKGDMFNIYNIRKRYSAIYYQFKPRAYYWVVIIIARKFAIAAINLMLRTDVEYMLASSLLIMFCALIMQLLHRPYMGPAEYAKVREKWAGRVAMLSTIKFETNPMGTKMERMRISKLPQSNSRWSAGMQRLRSTTSSESRKFVQWLVNYNTVEAVLLFSSVIVMLGGIMFSSDRFSNNKNISELATLTWIVLLIIFFSMLYYIVVFSLEVIAQMCPGICRKRCCDLEHYLGDGNMSRKRAAKEAEKNMIVELSVASSGSNALGFKRDKLRLEAPGQKQVNEAAVGISNPMESQRGKPVEKWTSHHDPTTDRIYWHDKDTDRTTWTEPTLI